MTMHRSTTSRAGRVTAAIFAAAILPTFLAACTDNTKAATSADPGTIKVSSTDKECKVSAKDAPSGKLNFEVKNDGGQVTEFYLLADDGLRIIGEVENIGPGLTRNLVLDGSPGQYFTACKPGMVGDGIRGAFTITNSGTAAPVDPDLKKLLDTGVEQYTAYVKDQTEQLIVGTKKFAEAYAAGDEATARSLYASTRMHWERIEPVAESFGDLDPKLDAREKDLEPGQVWTGWHRAEKDLYPPAGFTKLTEPERKKLADQLVADTDELGKRTRTVKLSPHSLGNGAKELLDEVATGKVTGEEEIWSHTDLWDFQANVDGARIAFESLKPALLQKDAALAKSTEEKFKALETELKKYAKGDGFVFYNELTPDQVKALASLVDALGEPLSKLTAAVVQ